MSQQRLQGRPTQQGVGLLSYTNYSLGQSRGCDASGNKPSCHSHLLLVPQEPPSFAFLHTGGLTLVSHALQAPHAGLHPPAAPQGVGPSDLKKKVRESIALWEEKGMRRKEDKGSDSSSPALPTSTPHLPQCMYTRRSCKHYCCRRRPPRWHSGTSVGSRPYCKLGMGWHRKGCTLHPGPGSQHCKCWSGLCTAPQ